MKVNIQLLNDADEVVAEYKGDASQPGGWRATSTQRLVASMPAQSDNPNTGTYELFGFTYQPHVHVERPNGYSAPAAPPQSPVNGQPSASPLPSSFPSKFLSLRPQSGARPAAISPPQSSDIKHRG